jgi:hypothetical protein
MPDDRWRSLARTIALMPLLVSIAAHASAQERYVSATVDKDGALRIVTATAKVIVPDAEPEREFVGKQVGYDNIQISADGQAVGWVALFPNCCTSYPIPLALVIFSSGVKRSYAGVGLPVWRWAFQADGKRVAFEQETVHGGLGIHYELRDVESGGLVASYEPEVGPDNQPLPNQHVPMWVEQFDAKPKR